MIVTKKISLQSGGNCDIIDITPAVEQYVADADASNGIVTIFVAGSTAGITTIEYESGLVSDLKSMWERTIVVVIWSLCLNLNSP